MAPAALPGGVVLVHVLGTVTSAKWPLRHRAAISALRTLSASAWRFSSSVKPNITSGYKKVRPFMRVTMAARVSRPGLRGSTSREVAVRSIAALLSLPRNSSVAVVGR